MSVECEDLSFHEPIRLDFGGRADGLIPPANSRHIIEGHSPHTTKVG
jgi:hypothetical protein